MKVVSSQAGLEEAKQHGRLSHACLLVAQDGGTYVKLHEVEPGEGKGLRSQRAKVSPQKMRSEGGERRDATQSSSATHPNELAMELAVMTSRPRMKLTWG